jgi:hypothetical protein
VLEPRLFSRVRSHLYSQLLCLGRHTITGLLSTQGRIHEDWSADYRLYSRKRLDPGLLFDCVRRGLDESLDQGRPLVVAIDDSILPKRGTRIPGVRWSRDPQGPPFSVNFIRAQRVLQFSAALEKKTGQARLIPVDFAHAPMAQRPKRNASTGELERFKTLQKELNINTVAARRLNHLAGATERPMVAVCDGRFANKSFLRSAPAQVPVITRIRKDSALFFAPEGQAATGRRRIYGASAPTPEQLRSDESVAWQRVRAFACGKIHDFKVKRLPGVFSALKGNEACQLVVIAPLAYRLRASSPLFYRQSAYLLCTDNKMPLDQLLQFYLWRWDIEVNFRDEKTLLGLGEAQVRNVQSADRVPATAAAAYGLLLLAASKAFPNDNAAELFPAPRWRYKAPPRLSTSDLLDRLRFELFAHAINPKSFTGFWFPASHNHKPPKPSFSLPSALFHFRN